jgi:hypothetical protein
VKTRIGAAAVLCLLLALATGAQSKSGVTGFFSDMRYVREAGGVIGTEVWISFARDQYWACVQTAEGEPNPPDVVTVDVSGSKIRFTIMRQAVDAQKNLLPEKRMDFAGTVSAAGIVGMFNGQEVNLKRKISYWQ